MTIVDYTVCPECGFEIELLTDGRLAEVTPCGETVYYAPDIIEAVDSTLRVNCPVVNPVTDTWCGTILTFLGEGHSVGTPFSADAIAITY